MEFWDFFQCFLVFEDCKDCLKRLIIQVWFQSQRMPDLLQSNDTLRNYFDTVDIRLTLKFSTLAFDRAVTLQKHSYFITTIKAASNTYEIF